MVGGQPKPQEMGCAVYHLLLIQHMKFGPINFVSLVPQLPYQQNGHNGFDSNQVSENKLGHILKVHYALRVQNVTSKEITLESSHPVKSSNTKL